MSSTQAQNDNLPVREYTNPEEIVTFDRTTSFSRAIDVINEFSQEFRNKPVLDRTNTEGNIGIAVAPKHWMDALKLILRVKELQLIESREFYEIVEPKATEDGTRRAQQVATGQGGGGEGEGPLATTQTKEVRINAIFFEGNRRALQEIGVDWSTISENTPESVTDAGEEGVQVPSSEFGDGPFVQVNSQGASNVSQRVFESVINFGEIGNTGIRVQSLFSAFEAENLGEILSSPTVRVMDGQEGRIQVGQDFSVKQRDFAGNVVEEFFSVGTILEVTPTIIEQNDTTFVHLDISAERSSAQPDPVSTVINKQQAETQALLLDGQTTVVAGLYRTERSQVRRGVPLLKDLPPWFFGLRYLFGYTSNDFLMRELVVLLEVSIEPTIPERMQRGIMTNKFKTLQKQRQQNFRDVEESDKIFNGQKLSDNLDLETDEEMPKPDHIPGKAQSNNTEDQRTVTAQEKEKQNRSEENQVKEQKKEEEESPPVKKETDIEVPKVELNLGGSEQGDAQGNNEETEATPEPVKEESVADNSPAGNTFYIIGGSFSQQKNAEKLRDRLQKEGFDPVLLQKSNSDVTYVSYQGYNDRQSASKALADIRQYQNSEAWLYKAK
ncbi:SPOR domain-containing protein [Fodinibius sp. SL11]|uniref:SPOR domain-containing protein n=1 Tax=Fodinibius sp. SL11 TaxID=3425690 RepID=UPI003F880396